MTTKMTARDTPNRSPDEMSRRQFVERSLIAGGGLLGWSLSLASGLSPA